MQVPGELSYLRRLEETVVVRRYVDVPPVDVHGKRMHDMTGNMTGLKADGLVTEMSMAVTLHSLISSCVAQVKPRPRRNGKKAARAWPLPGHRPWIMFEDDGNEFSDRLVALLSQMMLGPLPGKDGCSPERRDATQCSVPFVWITGDFFLVQHSIGAAVATGGAVVMMGVVVAQPKTRPSHEAQDASDQPTADLSRRPRSETLASQPSFGNRRRVVASHSDSGEGGDVLDGESETILLNGIPSSLDPGSPPSQHSDICQSVPSRTISGRPSHSAQMYLLTEHSRAGGLNLNPPTLHPRPSPPPVILNPKFGFATVIGQA
ncbi:hypothetical protein AUP68_13175 [Ilyonectria robusta]